MADDVYVTRRELDMLKAASEVEHARIWTKIEALDSHGSRGMDGLQIRMDSLIKNVAEVRTTVKSDIAEVRAEVRADIAEVKAEVKTDVGDLKIEMATRFQALQDVRWKRIGGWTAGIATGGGIIGLLIDILSRLHG